MSYPELQTKFLIVTRTCKIGGAAIVNAITELVKEEGLGSAVTIRDKSTYSRHLSNPSNLGDEEQDLLVRAVCSILKKKLRNDAITPKLFRTNDILKFCEPFKITQLELASLLGKSLPVPNLILKSVFQQSAEVEALVGKYLLFRHDKDQEDPKRPYLRACAEIYEDSGRYKYNDYWPEAGANPAYTGFVFCVGPVVNIIGDNARSKQRTSEVWWCGLERIQADDPQDVRLFGYVSDFSKGGVLFTDRIVLIRVEEKEWDRIRKLEGDGYLTQQQVEDAIGGSLTNYIDDWRDISIEQPG